MNKTFYQPLGGNEMPRCGGPATFMRLPAITDLSKLDVAIIGIPFDIGTSNRPGARLAPRQIRDESRMLRPYNMATRAAPFDSLAIADYGDVPINTYNLLKSIDIITDFYDEVLASDVKPFTMGGDHTIVLPILRAMAKKYGPVAVVHIDAHTDINDLQFGEKIAHGTPFRRAVEENLIDPTKVVQIGVRGTGYAADDFDWPREQGFRVVQAEACWYKSLAPLMAEVREQIGSQHPVYISFDIDGLDPAYAPGTGTAEVGGLTSAQGLEIVRGCRGLNVVGGDLVEVSPPYDTTGNTALLGATMLFEMLCALPEVTCR